MALFQHPVLAWCDSTHHGLVDPPLGGRFVIGVPTQWWLGLVIATFLAPLLGWHFRHLIVVGVQTQWWASYHRHRMLDPSAGWRWR